MKYLKKRKETHGYSLTIKEKRVMNGITMPFADDFNIRTRDKALHQQTVKDVEINIQSMGMIIQQQKVLLSIHCKW